MNATHAKREKHEMRERHGRLRVGVVGQLAGNALCRP